MHGDSRKLAAWEKFVESDRANYALTFESSRLLSPLVILLSLLILARGKAVAQYSTDPRITKTFEDENRNFARNGGAFVSSCAGPKEGEAIFLVLPLGKARGSLTILFDHKGVNGTDVDVGKGKVAIGETLGGESYEHMMDF